MSEYQYYEFRAIDRPLDDGELRALRSLSTRAEITQTSFVNTYHWGDFKGAPDALMDKYFDAFVYLANWGTRRFALRLPGRLLTRQLLASYCRGESLHGRRTGEFAVVDFRREEGSGEWEEGEGWMASLVPLRDNLLRGDQRCLYLGWLCCAQNEELDENEIEPPVPPGLKALSGSLSAFIEFMDIDCNLVDIAADASPQPKASPTRDELAVWIQALPAKDKDALLLDAALNAGRQLGAEILRRYDLSLKNDSTTEAPPKRRTVGELLAAASELAARRERMAVERQAAALARKEREAAEARARYLDQLAGSEQTTWQQVDTLIQTKQQNKYETAVNLLVDLRDLALRSKHEADFQAALGKLRGLHAAKPSLLRRLLDAGL
jgi:hypothetical protein